MFDANTVVAAVGVAILTMATLTLVLSRIIPDHYDRRAPVRQRINSGNPHRGR